MMYFEGGEIQSSPQCLNDLPTIAFCTIEEVPAVMEAVDLKVLGGFPHANQYGVRFESHKEYDGFTLHSSTLIPPQSDAYLGAVFNAMRLVVIYDDGTDINQLTGAIENGEISCEIAAVLRKLFDCIMMDDEEMLGEFENHLWKLEESIIADSLRDCVLEIMQIRKSLLLLNRYYSGLFRILQGLEENRNGFIPKHSLYVFRLLSGRVDRLSANIASLRDYAAQVREAYQNQLDIDLNQTMKLFTVITAIFLPLTLLAGWYGMNFYMPEYTWPWAYSAFIAVSAAVIVGLLVYFKKKKWF